MPIKWQFAACQERRSCPCGGIGHVDDLRDDEYVKYAQQLATAGHRDKVKISVTQGGKTTVQKVG